MGDRIARGVMAKKEAMKKLFIRVLGVEEEQADIDTCKIEHLISDSTARRAVHMLRFLSSDPEASESFVSGMEALQGSCGQDPSACAICDERCLLEQLGGS